ncbi:cadherin repeat domain-containing protein, partial [Alphaproteobacteria bacterium]|nr:cadherin repeat domain-containing protein [Alphaproteobacteria bacterium]
MLIPEAQLGGDTRIFAQILDPTGERVGNEFQVNTFEGVQERNAIVETLYSDKFVVIWHSVGRTSEVNEDIRGQILDRQGNKIGDEFTLNSTTVNSQNFPAITESDEGGFFASWVSMLQDGSGGAVIARKFDSSGNALTNEVIVNNYTSDNQTNPEIIKLADGNIALSWMSDGQDSSEYGLYGQILDQSLSKISGEFSVNSETSGNQAYHSMAALSNGSFVVVWENDNSSNRSEHTLKGQIFNPDGSKNGYEFKINTVQNDYGFVDKNWDLDPDVIGLEDGGFFVSYSGHDNQYGGYGQDVFGQFFNDEGNKIGPEFQINQLNKEHQEAPAVVEVEGGILVTFHSYNAQSFIREGNSYTDTSGHGIAGKFIPNPNIFADLEGEPTIQDIRVNNAYEGQPSLEFIFDRPVSVEFNGNPVGSIGELSDDSIRTQHYGINGAGNEFGDRLNLNNAQMREAGTVFAIDVTPNHYQGFNFPGDHKFWIDANRFPIDAGFNVRAIDHHKYEKFLDTSQEGTTWHPEIGKFGDGNLAVAWRTISDNETDNGIFLKVLDQNGNQISDVIKLNYNELPGETNQGKDCGPDITALPDGNLLVSWANEETYFALVKSDGTILDYSVEQSLSGAINVQTILTDDGKFITVESAPVYTKIKSRTDIFDAEVEWEKTILSNFGDGTGSSASILSSGNIMVVTNRGEGTSQGDVYLSAFDSAGNIILDRGAVSATSSVAERYASISELSDGNCVISYSKYENRGYELYAKIFNDQGVLVKDIEKVNNTSYVNQDQSDVISLGDSGFLISWRSDSEGSDSTSSESRVYGRFYDNEGNPKGNEFQINQYDVGDQPHHQEPPHMLFDEENERILTVFSTSENSQDIKINSMSSNIKSQTLAELIPSEFKFNDDFTDDGIRIDDLANGETYPNGFSYMSSERYLEEGSALESLSTISDPDGISSMSFQWQVSKDTEDWVNIIGANQDSFTPDDSEVGRYLRLQVSTRDIFETEEIHYSDISPVIKDKNEYEISKPIDIDSGSNELSESASIGTLTGVTALAEDFDATDDLEFYTLTEDAGGLFVIDSETGVVTLAGELDYEASTSHMISVLASSTDGSTNSSEFAISIIDNPDEYDISSITDVNFFPNALSEVALVGASAGITAFSEDLDGDVISYSLSDDSGGLFAIDSNNGFVTLAKELDYETSNSHVISILAKSTDGSSSSVDFTINVFDYSEFVVSELIDIDPSLNTISELATIGSLIGITAYAEDLDGTDSVSYA